MASTIDQNTEDKIVEYLRGEVALRASLRIDWRSPIEKAPCQAMYWVFVANLQVTMVVPVADNDKKGKTIDAEVKERLLVGDPKVLFIWRQVPVIDWPVDFLIGVTIPGETKIKWLVIECDGHDYHERTKEQAARDRSRDRALQSRGYTMFRFTGSEIFRDPVRCAEQVLRWANSTTEALYFDRADVDARSLDRLAEAR
jgi:very-short-patch-repair endonuclease